MLRLMGTWRTWAFTLLLAAFCVWLIGSSKTFQQCIRETKRQEARDTLEKGVPDLSLVFRRYKGCSGVYIVENKDAIGAISTFIVAVFTFTLWRATTRLWNSAESQLVEFRKSSEQAQTIADQHGAHLSGSVAAASRAATALEGVSTSIAANTVTTRELLERQRQFSMMQMRAYVSVLVGACVPQDRKTGWHYEVRMLVVNTGHTPAHAVTVTGRLQILPFPLPDDIDLNVPIEGQEESAHINTGQQRFFQRWLDDLISDEEITEITTGNARKLYLYGSIFYRDVFDEVHQTKFCQWCVWDVVGNFSTMNTSRHNDAT